MIIGAGYSGLIAAHIFPSTEIVESRPEPSTAHKALLRFRTSKVADVTGIPFTAVTVRKGIWSGGAFRAPTIALANAYSIKVVGRLVERSIWNLAPVTRYIAPENFYEQLLEATRNRIHWSTSAQFCAGDINTAPLPVALDAVGIEADDAFDHAGIFVIRYRIPSADVHQTVYFPDATHSLYRASITKDLLICEFLGEPGGPWESDLMQAFNLSTVAFDRVDEDWQRYGKILPLPDDRRKQLVGQLTDEHEIFSLGRFATWRNILLDDVVEDAAVIKRLMHATKYDRKMTRWTYN